MTRRTQNVADNIMPDIRRRMRELRVYLTQHPEDRAAHDELYSLRAQLDEVS